MYRLYALYALSGLLGLGYQVVWLRAFVDHFGSAASTFACVLTSFLGGLGCGSLLSRRLGSLAARLLGSSDPLRRYGLIELVAAAAAAATWLLPLLPKSLGGAFPYEPADGVLEPIGDTWLLQVLLGSLCVFVPCVLLGATFPLLCDGFVRFARLPAALYAWNSAGAAMGVLLAEFVLLPWLGTDGLLGALVATNVALGLLCVTGRVRGPADSAAPTTLAEPAPSARATPGAAWLLGTAILAGALTGAFEADVLRRLRFFDCRTGAAMSCISFWAIVAIFLASTTVRLWPRLPLSCIRAAPLLATALYAMVWQNGYGLRDWSQAADRALVRAAQPPLPNDVPSEYVFFDFGYGFGALLWFTGLFVLPGFYLLALALPYACNAAQRAGHHLGRLYGANTLAFAVGMIGFAVVVPYGNQFFAMRLFLWVLLGGALLMVGVHPAARSLWRPAAAAGIALLLGITLVPRDFAADWFPAGSAPASHPVRALRSDGDTTTFVVAEPPGDVLWFDSYRMTGSNAAAQQYMRLMAHLPLLAHERPARALLICFGVGMTASAIAAHPTVERLDIVDLNRQVFATAPEFASTNRNVLADPRVRCIHDDGRRYLDTAEQTYDFITSEPPPPMVAGVARLYSVDYYTAAKARLAPGGLLSQWLPIDQMPAPAMHAAIASFVQVFPDSLLFVGADTNYVLMGCNGPLQLATVERRFDELAAVRTELAQFGVRSARDLLARCTWSPAQLQARYVGHEVVRDRHNLFSHARHDPARPPVLDYDPPALLAGLRALHDRPLRSDAELEHVVLHLGRLKSLVQDFPVGALERVPAPARERVALADAPWSLLERHMQAASIARDTDPATAARHLQTVLQRAPTYLLAGRELGMLGIRLQRWDVALEGWRRVVAADDRDVEGHAGVILSLLQTNQHDSGLAAAEAACRRFPGTAAMQRLRGDALSALARKLDAIAAYDHALQLDPRDEAARTGRARCLEPR